MLAFGLRLVNIVDLHFHPFLSKRHDSTAVTTYQDYWDDSHIYISIFPEVLRVGQAVGCFWILQAPTGNDSPRKDLGDKSAAPGTAGLSPSTALIQGKKCPLWL